MRNPAERHATPLKPRYSADVTARDRAGDDQALDLAGAFEDGVDLGRYQRRAVAQALNAARLNPCTPRSERFQLARSAVFRNSSPGRRGGFRTRLGDSWEINFSESASTGTGP